MTTARQPVAFYHEDGFVPAWRFATKYAGPRGHIATLPEIIKARLATQPGDMPWETYFTTNSAEYYGTGADGRPKLIVAHGVGPMSTPEGIKKAYSWEYKDKSRDRRGGRISAEEFLKLEAGEYGEASEFDWSSAGGDVTVIDMLDFIEGREFPFHQYHTSIGATSLLLARLGGVTLGTQYLRAHTKHALAWHSERSIPLPRSTGRPYVVRNEGASNCQYTTYEEVNGRYDWSRIIPRPLEPGMAIGHLLSISGLSNLHTSSDEDGPWQGLISDIDCHEWSNGTRFVGVPAGASWRNGIGDAPQPDEVLRRDWQRFMQPHDNTEYHPPRLFLLESVGDEWFTRYPKPSDGERMDEGDIEFRVRSAQLVGGRRHFKVDEMFFLRYSLDQVVAVAPNGANAYDIIDISGKDARGLTTVTVQFYAADVDTSERLPRVKEVKQNYTLLMG